ncbi:AraC family transcriptional regulator [Paenibacillus sp. PAMC21692]|uniref:AraC family transcriptional regulator n=1 Tax=Paenibacillus sp. PAMC21692 TaxID=2762320 RepID=UPI00164ECD6C|nr:AraC family transcriptional regulator [Paenibacillus sp. PAMC21692]QNK56304.1 helix-turn-helix transcriptional regulator [Paenibacillus sp. PAMC21692]
MRFKQLDKEEYQGIEMYTIDQNGHGDYPFFIQQVSYDMHYYVPHYVPHRHDYFQIYYVSQGKLKHLINNKEYELIKGDLFVIPPYVPHSIAAYEKVNYEAIELEFKPELINQSFASEAELQSFMDFMYIQPFMVNESKVRPRFNLADKIETDVESIMNELICELSRKEPGFELIFKSLILRLLALVGRVMAHEYNASEKNLLVNRHKESILKAIKYLEEHYSEKIYLKDVVKVALLSHTAFCTAFKSVTNKSFTRYLNELRVSKAKEYLKKPDVKIIDVSSKAGFDNVVHFNRTFKQLMYMTPKEYREDNR